MRALVIIVTVLAALHAAYWVVGSRLVEGQARAALARLEAGGWEVSYDDLATRGFPSRFDTTLRGPRLAPPGGSFAWEAPFVQVLALSYRPSRLIAVLPPEQRLAFPGRPRLDGGLAGAGITLTAESLRASAALGLMSLGVEDARIEGEGLGLADDLTGYAARVGRVFAALRPTPAAAPGSYDLSLDATALAAGLMTAPADLSLRLTAVLDRPLDRGLQGAPALRALSGPSLEAAAGAGRLSARGDLRVGADGTLDGAVAVTMTGWDDLIAALREAGAIDEGLAVFYGRFLDQAAEGGDSVEIPLVIEGGRISALGLPLGEVPPLAPQRQ